MSAVVTGLVNGILASALLVSGLWLALRLIPRRAMNAATRYAIWWAALVITIALPVFNMPDSYLLEAPFAHVEAPRAFSDIAEGVAIDSPSQRRTSLPEPVSRPSFRWPSLPIIISGGDWPKLIPAVWAMLSIAMLIRLVLGWLSLGRILRRARKANDTALEFQRVARSWCSLCAGAGRNVEVVSSSEITAPVAIGPNRPSILIPAALLEQLDTEELDQVGMHEAAHLIRRDDYALHAQRIIEALFVIHPVVRWISRRIDLEREIACDDFVIRATGRPHFYAWCLTRIVEVSGRVRFLPVTGMAGRRSHLSRRVEVLLDNGRDIKPSLLKLRFGGMTVLLALSVWVVSRTAPFAFRPPTVAAEALRRTSIATVAAPLAEEKGSGTLSGIAVTATGAPVAGVRVDLFSMKGPGRRILRETSAGDGRFSFDETEEGRYLVRAEHPRYVTAANADGAALTINGSAGEFRLELVESSRVAGVVVDESGAPFPDALVEVLRVTYYAGRHVLTTVSSAETDANGAFEIGRIGPGRYYLRASYQLAGASNRARPLPSVTPGMQDLRYASTYYPNSPDPSGASTFDVSNGQNLANLHVRMRKVPFVHVRGKVVGNVASLRDARVVRLTREPGYPLGWRLGAPIQDDGSFDLTNMWPGQFTIAVLSPRGERHGWTLISITDRDLEGVVINADASNVTGSVRVEESSRPLLGVRVQLTAAEGPSVIVHATGVADNGAFTIPRVPPGKYRASLLGIPSGHYLKAIRFGMQNGLDEVLDLSKITDRTLLEIVLSAKAGILEGVAVGADGKPVSGGVVTLVPDSPRPGHEHLYPTAQVDNAGHFYLPALMPGSYRIYAWEQFENSAHWNEDFMKAFERGQRIRVGESSRERRTIVRISATEFRQALYTGRSLDDFYRVR